MEGKANERWCMLRCAGGAQDKAVNIDRIMLGFRPIAPKPVIGGSASGNLQVDNKSLLISSRRSKRKYVRVRRNNNGYRRKNKKTGGYGSKDGVDNNLVTLQLLPERADFKDSTQRSESWCNILEYHAGKEKVISNNNNNNNNNNDNLEQNMRLMLKNHRDFSDMVGFSTADQTVVESWVSVESVTGACMDGRGLGSEDVEIMQNLAKDTCPGFITDGLNKVKWVNEAYRKMVTGSEEKNGLQSADKFVISVSVVMKEKLPCLFSSLTCRVKTQYTWQKEKYSKMVPCDIWRLMECGGFAWRLDVEAALSLGR
ncbi:von willebrand factor A domain protein [Melia azedarach]|uniref:von willebrand factor A domain protein n=2 Tax=Melia azedarach TaxID=155640 RepID=A0ACC1Z107_MELAZ|nr:von willebrand factor A domain protein [Melia azedarach]KAJ4729406.1 von willebrand factor A domain protein [Melia azedarach]